MKHLYLHVPFCSRRCIYCDFSIAVRREIPARHYVNSILREYRRRKAVDEWDDAPLETLYLGGGTPSLLPTEHVSELLAVLIEEECGFESIREVTLEVNPENVTGTSALEWVNAGVNRVSLGVQSFDEKILRWMHRNHTPRQAKEAVVLLRNAGVKSVSLDLIFALPDELGHNFSEDLSRALELEPEHLSVYGLTVEPKTALSRWIQRGAVAPATEGGYTRDFLNAHETLTQAGYEHYEVSNYSKPGSRALHNLAYWNGSRYAGLGPSAHGYDGNERRWNVAPWALYERLISEAGDATVGREALTSDQAALERVYLALRVSNGLDLGEIKGFNQVLVGHAREQGWADTTGSRWHLTPRGWLRLDELVTALTTSPEGG